MLASTLLPAQQTAVSRGLSYAEYVDRRPGAERAATSVRWDATTYTSAEGVEVLRTQEGESVLETDEVGFVEWRIEVPATGLYVLAVRYRPFKGKSAPIERELHIEGEVPFREARSMVLQRTWKDEETGIRRDNRDNHMRPRQVEVVQWREQAFRDMDGYYNGAAFELFLREGETRIRLTSLREPVALDWLELRPAEELRSFKEALGVWNSQGYHQTAGQEVTLQAEGAAYKSSPSLYPEEDRTEMSVQPYHPSRIRLNTIGGTNWRRPGQWIEWEVDVPERGLYQLTLRLKQNQLRGLSSHRRLYVNGEVPYRELDAIPIDFAAGWRTLSLTTDSTPALIPMEEGTNTIRLEVTLGELSQRMRQVEGIVYELNSVYRRILMITGPTPDPYRTYRLHVQVPGLLESFIEIARELDEIVDSLYQSTGQYGAQTAVLSKLSHQLQDFVENKETIHKRIDEFKVNLGALGSWLFMVRNQPLQLDYLVVHSPDITPREPRVGFFRRLYLRSHAFLATFFEDYNIIGNTDETEKALEVWVIGGRERAIVLRRMIDDSFTRKTGVPVNLRLISQEQILLPAALAGEGPDVALNVQRATPINFAIRDAVHDLTQFPGFDDVTRRFHGSSMRSFSFDDAVYGLPETQVFDVLFYRKDILEELDIEVPETWEELFRILPILQKQNLEFGLPVPQPTIGNIRVWPPSQTFAMLLFQHGGEFYSGDATRSALNSETGLRAFKQWTEFYTNYKVPLEYNFENRFRQGEMPLAIAYFRYYNQLTVFAPELRGLWGIAPVPGLRQPDGSVSRAVSSESTAAIMLKDTDQPEQSWEFLNWWTSTEAQIRYGREMESLLGAAARHPTANMEALSALPWPVSVYEELNEQWKHVQGIPEVPGGYFAGRHIENAFRTVVFEGANPRETLLEYVEVIDEEIEAKRKELGIE